MNFSKFIIIFLTISLQTFAQDGIKEKKEQLKELKKTFFTSELNLTDSEAEKFWPLYNAYDDKQFDIRHNKIKCFKKLLSDTAINKISEKEAGELLSQIENTDEELYDLKKRLFSKLKSFLPNVKILKLKKAEEDFNRKLLKQYKEKKQ